MDRRAFIIAARNRSQGDPERFAAELEHLKTIHADLWEASEPLPEPTKRKITPEAPVQWPLVLRPLKLMAHPEDRGLGDIIARTIGPVGGDAFKAWYKKVFNRNCGCVQRQETWNAHFPLPS